MMLTIPADTQTPDRSGRALHPAGRAAGGEVTRLFELLREAWRVLLIKS